MGGKRRGREEGALLLRKGERGRRVEGF